MLLKNIEANVNLAAHYYLALSYLYYIKDISVVSDAEYDAICEILKTNFEAIEYQHKDLIDLTALEAGTGFYITAYPPKIISAATYLQHNSDRLRKLANET